MNYGNRNVYLLHIKKRSLLKQIPLWNFVIDKYFDPLNIKLKCINDSIVKWKMTYRSNLTGTTVKGLMAYVGLSLICDAIKDDVVLDTKLYRLTMSKTCSMIILNVFENYNNKWNIILFSSSKCIPLFWVIVHTCSLDCLDYIFSF